MFGEHWKIIALAAVVAALGFFYTLSTGVPLTVETVAQSFVPALLVSVAYIAYLILKRYLSRKPMPGITIEESKFAFARHLLEHFGINLFISGRNYRDAKYLYHIMADRFYPSGEEMWVNRVVIRGDHRFLGGKDTFIIGFVDGFAKVVGDPLMNDEYSINMEMWRDPGSCFSKGTPRTRKPRSLHEIIAKHAEETGELPEGFTPASMEPVIKEDDKKSGKSQ